MTLTTAQQVRLRIQDQPLIADATYFGDGTATQFPLPHRNLISGTAFIPVSAGWSATGCTFDVTGWLAFSGVISANSAWRARYVHSVFSDDEIGQFTAAGGNVAGAALEAVKTLMFDSLKRASWAAPDGTEYDDTKAMDQLRALYNQLREEQAQSEVAAGSVVEWSVNQGEWW